MRVPETSPNREDFLLLIAEGAEGGTYPFDAIRAVKGCFLVAERGRPAWRQQFSFRPYDYGPFDPGVYRARDQLLAEGLLAETAGQYPGYTVTEAGRARCQQLEAEDSAGAAWLRKIGRWTTSRAFGELLRQVYAAFPEYATQSIARVG